MEPYQQLEDQFVSFCGNENTVACASGTAALHLAMEVLRTVLGPQAKVALPDLTMMSCARAISLAGLTPVFVDVDHYGLLLPSFSQEHDAVLTVHLYGRKAPTKFGVPVIEDLSEAHGLLPNPRSFAACWSFYKNKVIHGEEGGMVAFQDPAHAQLAKQLRNLGFTRDHDFTHIPRGMNYRLSNLHAQPILESLRNFSANLINRRRVWHTYYALLPQSLPTPVIPWVYDLDVPDGPLSMPETVSKLRSLGIEARHSFKPLSSQEEYRGPQNGSTKILTPRAHRIAATRMYLPIHPGMKKEEIYRNVQTFQEIVQDTVSIGP